MATTAQQARKRILAAATAEATTDTVAVSWHAAVRMQERNFTLPWLRALLANPAIQLRHGGSGYWFVWLADRAVTSPTALVLVHSIVRVVTVMWETP